VPVALTAAPASAATWKWCSSAAEGTWQNGGYFVQNDAWNGGHGPQRICANSFHDVQVTSNQPTGNTEIETYPDVSGLYTGTDEPVSDFASIANHFTEHFPAGVIGEAADDIWLNNWNIEIMLWTDTHHENPASFMTHIGTATIFGQTWNVLRNGPASEEPNTEFVFKLDHNETSGTTHILTAIHWLMSHGHIPSSAGLTAAQFGWEIASTNGPQVFHLTSYSLTHSRK